MEKRKEKYGFERGVDLIIKPEESLKVGDEVISMQEILESIRLESGEVIEKAGLRAASSLLGHLNPTVTANVYGHLSAERTRHQVRTLAPVKWPNESNEHS